MKDPLAISLILSSSVIAIFVIAISFGFVNHPGHCGVTNPHDIDWEEIYSDAGTVDY